MTRTFHPLCLGAALLGAAFSASCVSEAQYDEAIATAKRYEQRYYDLEQREQALDEENRSLKRQLEAANAVAVEAGAEAEQRLQDRMQELDRIMAELGTNPGDATKFEVDGGYVYRVKDAILFALGSAEVSSDGAKLLRRIAADIEKNPGRVYVRGHTDNVPIVKPETKKKYPLGNMQLSVARALNVASVLTQAGGVPENRVVVMGFGPNEPIAPNDSAANRRKNRRVEIFVSTDEAGSR